jgi:hypothetical protein
MRIMKAWDELLRRPRLYSEQEDRIERINRAWSFYDCYHTLAERHYRFPDNSFQTPQPTLVSNFMRPRKPKPVQPLQLLVKERKHDGEDETSMS